MRRYEWYNHHARRYGTAGRPEGERDGVGGVAAIDHRAPHQVWAPQPHRRVDVTRGIAEDSDLADRGGGDGGVSVAVDRAAEAGVHNGGGDDCGARGEGAEAAVGDEARQGDGELASVGVRSAIVLGLRDG